MQDAQQQELDQDIDVFNVAPLHAVSISQSENYRIRYVELIRTIGGLFLAWIYHYLSRTTSLTGTPLMLVSTTIANFAAWILGEQIIHRLCLYLNLYTEARSRNPLYRNFKTLASLGFSIGILLALVMPVFDVKTDVFLLSTSVAFLSGLAAFVVRYFRQSLSPSARKQQNLDQQLGTEGWSKYTKLALSMGTSIGQVMGACVAYTGGYDTLNSWTTITIYGAVVSTCSFFAMAISVPLINYLTRGNQPQDRGILVCDRRDVFNTNYIRSGMTLGVTIGTILGGWLAPMLVASLSVSVGIALGAGVISIFTGLVLGVYGHRITLYFQTHWGVEVGTDNSWSFATRNTSNAFGFIGIAAACLFCPGAALLQSAVMSSAVTGFIGWFVGLGIMWKARRIEPMEDAPTSLPWTQRISTGSNRGATIGAFAGLAIAMFGFYPGALGLTGIITLGYGLGGIIGGIYQGQDDEVARRIIRKIWYDHHDLQPSPITESYRLTELRLQANRSVSPSSSSEEDELLPDTPSDGAIDSCEMKHFKPLFHQSAQKDHSQIPTYPPSMLHAENCAVRRSVNRYF